MSSRLPSRARQSGFTLLELLLSVAIGALIVGGLGSLVMMGLKAQTSGVAASEQAYTAGFALERMVSRTRAAPVKALIGTPSESTGDWLAPLMFCRSATRLRETTVTDDTCSAGVVLAEGVAAFTVQEPAGPRPLDSPVITFSLTIVPANAPEPRTVTASARLGGGTL